jgi:hypothetical protein
VAQPRLSKLSRGRSNFVALSDDFKAAFDVPGLYSKGSLRLAVANSLCVFHYRQKHGANLPAHAPFRKVEPPLCSGKRTMKRGRSIFQLISLSVAKVFKEGVSLRETRQNSKCLACLKRSLTSLIGRQKSLRLG